MRFSRASRAAFAGLGVLAVAAVVAGCGGGGSSSSVPRGLQPQLNGGNGHLANPTLYVSGQGGVYAYDLGASGNTAPVTSTNGYYYQSAGNVLASIAGIATNSNGDLVVVQNYSNAQGDGNSCQLVFVPARTGPAAANTTSAPCSNGSGTNTTGVALGVTFTGPAPNGTPTPGAQSLFVARTGSTNQIQRYALPLSSSSTPTFTIGQPNVSELAADQNGNLAAGAGGSNAISIYSAPVNASSTPSAQFTNTPGTTDGQLAFTSTGDLAAGTVGPIPTPPPQYVNFFPHPFSNGTTAASSVALPANVSALGVAFDPSQNLYVAGENASDSSIYVYAPPYTSPSPIVHPSPSVVYQQAVASATLLFVTEVGTGNDRIDVYYLPLTAASTPAFSIPVADSPEGVALDNAGNLYVGTFGGRLLVYSPPFSPSSTPSVTDSGSPSILSLAISAPASPGPHGGFADEVDVLMHYQPSGNPSVGGCNGTTTDQYEVDRYTTTAGSIVPDNCATLAGPRTAIGGSTNGAFFLDFTNGSGTVEKYDNGGTVVATGNLPGNAGPIAVSANPTSGQGYRVVANVSGTSTTIYAFKVSGGTLVFNRALGTFNNPVSALAVDNNGSIYVGVNQPNGATKIKVYGPTKTEATDPDYILNNPIRRPNPSASPAAVITGIAIAQ